MVRIDPIAARKDQLARWEAHIAAGNQAPSLRAGAVEDLRYEIERMEAAAEKRAARRGRAQSAAGRMRQLEATMAEIVKLADPAKGGTLTEQRSALTRVYNLARRAHSDEH